MDMRLPRDAGCVGTLFGGHVSTDKTDKFQENIAVEGNKGRVPLRVHDGGLRGLGGMLVEARQETRRESVVKASGCGRNRWLARGQRSAVSSTSGKDDGSLAGDGRAMGWAVGALGHVQGPPVTAQRGSSHFQLFLALDW